ncbi:50S ribosomal protein L18 [Rickettsiales endosymbiont of Paramecium tredecaurelia]|uniref:50S ribosomal protein L18 n=1 Tax=Candidatus Sarmatiella mevalonica TaxID=2770581 RepID=UPI001924B128|nr:50S ribosomal protein L18 [Candidatus Sarmatiella mevalonica]MBL3284436.1 50S ribosomal protein L18 [Candidatus Sarmatiella mevalonica]
MRNAKRRAGVRKLRVRSRIARVSDRCRLSIFKSCRHVHAQLIDLNGNPLLSASTLERAVSGEKTADASGAQNTARKSYSNKEFAKKIGALIAERASKIGVVEVVLDRGPYKYHGVVEAFANAAREKGLKF